MSLRPRVGSVPYALAIDRKAANWWARAAAGAMGVLALVVVVWPGVRNLDLSEDSFPTHEEAVTVTETSQGGATTTETVTRRTSVSWWDRALGGAGVILLGRIALAFAAAFVAGGVVQRALLGRFAFRAGGFELPEVSAEAEEGIEQLQAQMDELLGRIDELQTQIDIQQALIDGVVAEAERAHDDE